MATDEVVPARAVWRLGDYHRFAREQIWEVGPVVVEACGISRGQRVLDVAAGSGNVAAPYMPAPPPGAQPPELWGTEAHVRELLGERIESLQTREHVFTERAPSPQAYVDLYKETFGPVISIYESLRTEPDRAARLDSEFLDFAERANRGAPAGPTAYPYEYVVIVARKRSEG